jgi:1-phosphofructokinase family hexose kinase
MICTVTLNPCIDLLLFLQGMKIHDTNRVQRMEKDAGGKGVNVSRVAAELGTASTATGFLGGGAGAYVEKTLEDQGVVCRFVWIDEETRINVSVEDGTGEPPTTFNAQGPRHTGEHWEELLSITRATAKRANWLCLGGSLPPSTPREAWRTLCQIGREEGAKVALDADGEVMKLGMEAGPDLIKPNLKEAERLLGRALAGTAEAVPASHELRQRLVDAGSSDPIVILSMGAQGAILCSSQGTWMAHPAPVEVKSTIGSGDSLIGGFLSGLERGWTLAEAIALGSASGAATAATDGTEIGRKSVIESLLPLAKVEPLA